MPMFFRSRFTLPASATNCVLSFLEKLRQLASTSQLIRTIRIMGPAFIALSFAGVAHAQGTMDVTGAQTLMGTFKTFAIYAGAVICFGGLIFAGIRMLSGRFSDAIPGLFGALFGAGVLGWGAGWIGSLTGQTM
jgi:hypothetical protein